MLAGRPQIQDLLGIDTSQKSKTENMGNLERSYFRIKEEGEGRREARRRGGKEEGEGKEEEGKARRKGMTHSSPQLNGSTSQGQEQR